MRVRFAPSPTGFLHLGGLRTALFNFLIARKYPDGKFILRIEDTDRTRLVPTAIDQLQRTLKWTGIEYDEGPDKPGKFGPYIQSERLKIYDEHFKELIETKRAYRCFCSKERLETVKLSLGRYDGLCRNLNFKESEARAANNQNFIVRFRTQSFIPEEFIKDEIYGVLHLNQNQLDDVVLMKSDGFPTYHFANIVDDHLMQIDLVMRGAEWLPSTPLHGLLYEAFGWKKPRFVHLPLLINPDGSKLSKRQDSARVSHYMNSGILPSALTNFVAFLGWTPTKAVDVLSMSDLIEEFDLKQLNNSDSTVNFDKLKWLNRQHLKLEINLPLLTEQLNVLVQKSFPESRKDFEYLKNVIKVSADRIFFIKDIIELCPYFFVDPDYDSPESLDMLSKIKLNSLIALDGTNIKAIDIPSPLLRLIVTGCKVGPPIQETVKVLGNKVCDHRIKKFKSIIKTKN